MHSSHETNLIQETGNNVFVTFNISNEIFGINVLTVQEIIGMVHITPVPCTNASFKGVINLRGRVVPVVDMRVMFRLEEKLYDASTVIIITDVCDKSAGLIVDAVLDVLDIPLQLANDYMHNDGTFKSNYISSIANYNDELILIIDPEKLVDEEFFESIENIEPDHE